MKLSLQFILMYLNEYAPLYSPKLPLNRKISCAVPYIPGQPLPADTIAIISAADAAEAKKAKSEALYFVVNNYTGCAEMIPENMVFFERQILCRFLRLPVHS